ncbi:MAG: hypothetical protein WDA16_12130 [Candidatus Thermoplasmatota archaeon]
MAFTPTGLADYSLARETNTAAACREYLEPISGLVFDCDPLLGFHPTGEIASLGPRFASALLYERDDPMPATGVVCEGQICIDGQAGIVGEHCVEFVVDIEFYDTAGTHTSSSGSAAGPFCGDLRPLVYVWMVEEWYFNAEHCHAMFTSLTKVDGQQLGPSHTIDRNTC